LAPFKATGFYLQCINAKTNMASIIPNKLFQKQWANPNCSCSKSISRRHSNVHVTGFKIYLASL